MKELLLVSIGFSPNVGGIETHFDDLINVLVREKYKVSVLTYKPLTTDVSAPLYEKAKNIEVIRLPIFGKFFYKLINKPLLEFLYLMPMLFIVLPVLLLTKNRSTRVIHSHGLIAGFVSVFWGRIFNKRVITTTHSIYKFPKKGFYHNLVKWIFNNSSSILTLSRQSREEVINLGIKPSKVIVFTYWVNQQLFRPIKNAKQKLSWNKFSVLFVGRLIKEKGLIELLKSTNKWNKNIDLLIAGTGPLDDEVRRTAKVNLNVKILGKIDQKDLPLYYSGADLLIVPSTSEEGFGRVIIESLSCGTPVVGANRGAIPEAIDETVGQLISADPKSITYAVNHLYSHPKKLMKLKQKAKIFANQRYSDKNAKTILSTY